MPAVIEANELETSTIESPGGMRLTVLNLGATVKRLEVPVGDEHVDVVLGYTRPEDYLDDKYYMGATVGRYANRIGGARFKLNGVEYQLDANEAPAGNCLHGGGNGLHRQLFKLTTEKNRVRCERVSPDGEGGFPGTLEIAVDYVLRDDNSLVIDFLASNDQETVASLANHAYFNLGGPIDEHEVRICADAFTPVGTDMIPTGEIRAVANSAMDLRQFRHLGSASFDHNFALDPADGEPRLAAQLRSRASSLQMNLLTTQDGLQFYTADHLAGSFSPRQGLCLEAQGYPDAPNQPGFPSARISPGSPLRHRTILTFESLTD